jgi:hypothetical protein
MAPRGDHDVQLRSRGWGLLRAQGHGKAAPGRMNDFAGSLGTWGSVKGARCRASLFAQAQARRARGAPDRDVHRPDWGAHADLGRPLPILVDELILQRCLPAETCSGVGLDVLHNDDDLPVRTLRDRVPDGQTVEREMETVRTRQWVYFGERVGKCRDWFFEQVKIARWAAFRSGCGSSSISSQVRSGKRRTRSLTNSPRLRQFPAGKSTAFPRV